MNTIWRIPSEIFRETVAKSSSLKEITKSSGFKNINNYDSIRERIELLGLNTSHLKKFNIITEVITRKKREEWREEVQQKCNFQIANNKNVYPPNEKEITLMNQVKKQMESIPDLITRLAICPTDCEIDIDNVEFKGVVYIGYITSTKQIVYIGSSKTMNKRKITHKCNIKKTIKSEIGAKFYKYLVENGQLEHLKLIPILKCEAGYGFECHFEALLIKLCASIFPLQNYNIPVVASIKMNSIGIIYGLFLDDEKIPKYVGQSIKYYERVVKHMTLAYDKDDKENYKRNLYVNIRKINNDEWSTRLEFRIIEMCEYWLLDQRESYYINKYDMKNNGWNSLNNISTQELVNDAKANHNNSPCMQKVECPHCKVVISNKYHLEKHIEKMHQNGDSSNILNQHTGTRNILGKGSVSKSGNLYEVRTPMVNGVPGKLIDSFKTREEAQKCLVDYQNKVKNKQEIILKPERRKRGSGTIRKKGNTFQTFGPQVNGNNAPYIGSYKTHKEAEEVLDKYLAGNNLV